MADQIQISLMQHNEIRESAEVLSHAMLNNPLHVAIFNGAGETERLKIEKMFIDLFKRKPGIIFAAKEDDKIIGVMRMNSCSGKVVATELAEPDDEQDIESRLFSWRYEWDRRDPKEQHWHLGPIGVLPSHQGLGIGSLLMKRFCMEVDACKTMAYLETDLDINVRFYEKNGFRLVEESEIFGVKNQYMIREAYE